MELRQLRYFIAVADELHFGRAAERVHITSPSLSQQIKALEQTLGVSLFERDRRHVALTSAGRLLLPDAREIVSLADAAQRKLAGTAGPLRFGYVSWLPDQLVGSLRTDLRVDEWVMPSHIQVARVLDGGLDAAIAWTPAADPRLEFRLIWAEPLEAVTPAGAGVDAVAAEQLTVLVDADLTSWDAWNQFAADYAAATGARVLEIDDGGITGPGFHQHCARLGRPVLASPKRHTAALPAGLRSQAIRDPAPLWCWSLVTRAGDDRPTVEALRADAAALAGATVMPDGPVWLPPADPHRAGIGGMTNQLVP